MREARSRQYGLLDGVLEDIVVNEVQARDLALLLGFVFGVAATGLLRHFDSTDVAAIAEAHKRIAAQLYDTVQATGRITPEMNIALTQAFAASCDEAGYPQREREEESSNASEESS